MTVMDEVTYATTTTARIVKVNLIDGSYRLVTADTIDQQLQMDMACSDMMVIMMHLWHMTELLITGPCGPRKKCWVRQESDTRIEVSR